MRRIACLVLLLALTSAAAEPPPGAEAQPGAEARIQHFREQAAGRASFKLLQRMNKLTRIIGPRQQGEAYVPDDIDHKYAGYLQELQARRQAGEGEAALCLAWLDYESCRGQPCAQQVVDNIRLAAGSGIALAMDEMAKLYRDGYGVPPSRHLASDWFVRAARGYREQKLREAALHSADQALTLTPDHAEAQALRRALAP